MQEIRAGVIGLGGFFKGTHLPCMKRVEGLRIVAACARREASRDAVKPLLGPDVKYYADHRELLADPNVNAVYVLTQPEAMPPIVVDVAKANKPLFCEKTPGYTAADARMMADAASAAGIINLVAFNRRFGPFTDRVRQWMAAAGKPTRIESYFRRVFTRAPEHIVGNGAHGVDMTISLMGPVRRVMGAHGAPRPGQGFCHFAASFEFVSGAVGVFMYDNRSVGPDEAYNINVVSPDTLITEHIQMTCPAITRLPGTAKRTRLTYKAWGPSGVEYDKQVEDYVRPDLTGDDVSLIGGGFQAEHDAFVAAVRANRPAGPTLAETVHSMEVAEAIQAGVYREFK